MDKRFFHCKKAMTVLLVVVFVAFFITNKRTYAAEVPVFGKDSNAIYRIINDYEFLLITLSDAAAGLIICGPLCALATGVIGAGEEVLTHYGYTDKRYLTSAILGGAIGKMFNEDLGTIGAISGIFFAGSFESHEKMIAPTFMIALGTQAQGFTGLILSVSGCAIDGLLSGADIAGKNPVTTFILVPKFTYEILGPWMAGMVFVYLNLFVYNKESFIDNLKNNPVLNFIIGPMMESYLRVAGKLYENYDKLIPPDELKKHFEKNLITLIGGQILIYWLMERKMFLDQNLIYRFEHLDQENTGEIASNPFVSGGIKLAIFIFPWVAGQFVTNSIEKYYNDRLSIILKDNIQNKLYTNDNLLRLSNEEDFSVYMDNLNRDAAIITIYGSSLLNSAVSASVGGAYGARIVVSHSKSLLVYTFLFQTIADLVAQYLAAQGMSYEDNVKSLYSELLDMYKDTKQHVRTIVERDGIDITGTRIRETSNALVETEGKKNLWNMGLHIYLNANRILGTILNYYLVGREIQQNRLPFEERNRLRKAIMDESEMFSWGGRNLAKVGQIEKSLDRLILLTEMIESPSKNIDQIERIMHDKNQLMFQNLEFGVGDRLLATADEIKFTLGKVYTITGETGCGKTSLLSKIKGIKENGIYGKGTIYYPKINDQDPKIVMLSQQDYFPINSSLKQVLFYPNRLPDNPELNAELSNEMNILLEEMGLYRFISPELNLESRENWYNLLSGGEKKKMLIISAMLKKPDIFLLDEVFSGLDQKSVETIEKILKKRLSKSLILVVDHHAQDNNYNSFYDGELHFSNKRKVILDDSFGKKS